jgi:O-antigen ligase/tetratricopeptide (TPR) repeat protein
MSNNQLRAVILIGLFAVPFVPLIVMKTLFFPFITGKALFFRFVIEIIFACYVILAVRDFAYRPKFTWILGSMAAFLVFIGLADLFAVNSHKAFWSNYERMEGFLAMLHLGAYFLVAGSVLKTQAIWNKLLATSVGVSALMSIYSFLQIAGKITINQGGVRVDGTLGNASYLGIYMVFHIFFAAILFVRVNKNWQRILLAVVGVMDLIVLYYTATRGAILGLIGGSLLALIFLIAKSEKGEKIRKIGAGILGAIVLVVAVFLIFKDTSFIRQNQVLGRFSSLSFSEIKTQGRYFVWPMAIKGFLDRPILGWGQEGFNFVFNKYYDPRMYNQEPWFDRAHNTYLDWLIAGGALGLLSYLAVIYSFLYYLFKNKEDFLRREDKAIMLGLLAAYGFHNLFVFDQIGSYIFFFLILAYIHSHATESTNAVWSKISTAFSNFVSKESRRPVIESGTVVVLVIALFFVVYAPWKQNKNLLQFLYSSSQGKGIDPVEAKDLLDNYNMGFPESLEHISQAAISNSGNPSMTNENKMKVFEIVDEAFKMQIAHQNNDARYRLFYGMFLSRYGWYGRAIEELKKAVELSPKKQTIYFELISNLMLDGKISEAFETAKKTYELEPAFNEAKYIYGLSAVAVGDNAVSQSILGSVSERELVFDDRYLSVLVIVNRNQDVINIAKRRVELDSNNMQHWITLTAAYLRANLREEAINTIRKMIELNPSFKEQGEYYISEIRAGRNP